MESKLNPTQLARHIVCSPALCRLTKLAVNSCLTPSRHAVAGSLRAVADHLRLRRAALIAGVRRCSSLRVIAAVVSQLRTLRSTASLNGDAAITPPFRFGLAKF
ncbi:hypothetical protein AAHA92_29067 [Salvia divinorum]|uniref:Uncharacterized protein n=1 Tax=Salvia divinorum TaxID=28513 RepID=A0ABD1FX45_SALDI